MRISELRFALVDLLSTERVDVDLPRFWYIRDHRRNPAKPLEAEWVVRRPPACVIAWLEAGVVTGRPAFEHLPLEELECAHSVLGVRVQDGRLRRTLRHAHAAASVEADAVV